jgi:hypothetical protein
LWIMIHPFKSNIDRRSSLAITAREALNIITLTMSCTIFL